MPQRHDLTTSPDLKSDLLTARRGTAFYSRHLENIDDTALDDESLLPGWSRRKLVAHVGYNARALTRLVHWANTGVETPMYESQDERNREINLGATLPAHALRHLHAHAAISLNVEWRDTPDAAWTNTVRTAQGRWIPLTKTVWMRIREVWIHAIDLASGAQFSDIPTDTLARLLRDITDTWKKRGEGQDICIQVSDNNEFTDLAYPTNNLVSGSLPDVVRWATGRGSMGLTAGKQLDPPRWI